MTLAQFFRRIGRSRGDKNPPLTERHRAFIARAQKGLEGWTEEELEAVTYRTLEGHEDELHQAFRDADEHHRTRKQRR